MGRGQFGLLAFHPFVQSHDILPQAQGGLCHILQLLLMLPLLALHGFNRARKLLRHAEILAGRILKGADEADALFPDKMGGDYDHADRHAQGHQHQTQHEVSIAHRTEHNAKPGLIARGILGVLGGGYRARRKCC